MGGIMSYLKPLAIGTAAGIVAPRVPILNTLPYSGAIAGVAAGYLTGSRQLPKLAVAGLGGYVVAPIAGGAINSATGVRIY